MRVVTVEEGADAVLPCSSNGAVVEFDWKKDNGEDDDKEVFLYTRGSHDDTLQDDQFKGRVDIFEDELKAGNASIKINSTKLEDNGTYICVLGPLHKHPRQEFYIRLNVGGLLKIRNVTGAAPKPSVNKLQGTGDWSLLECEALGAPKPEVEWRDSIGNVLNPKELKVIKKGRLFHVISEVIVTKTDHYTCVATQKEIYHQINKTIFEVFQDLVIVIEGEDAVLPCSLNSKENIEKMVFVWKKDNKEVFLYKDGRVGEGAQFKERVSHFKNELKFGNAFIRIKNTKMTDSGTYICHFPAKQETYIKLHVVRAKDDSAVPALSSAVAVLSIFLVVDVLYVPAA